MKILLLVILAILSSGAKKPEKMTVVLVASGDIFQRGTDAIAERFYASGLNAQQTNTPFGLERMLKKSEQCFVYVSARGFDREGAILGANFLSPDYLQAILQANCKGPSFVVISTCYSGTYIEQFRPTGNYVLLTSTAVGRTSFGCGSGALGEFQYTGFDACFLEAMDNSFISTWGELNLSIFDCVSKIETQSKLFPSYPTINFNRVDPQTRLPWRR